MYYENAANFRKISISADMQSQKCKKSSQDLVGNTLFERSRQLLKAELTKMEHIPDHNYAEMLMRAIKKAPRSNYFNLKNWMLPNHESAHGGCKG